MDHIVDIKDKKVAYTDVGSGPAIVFIHGWSESRMAFKNILPILSRRYRCISIDLPGFGESDAIEKVTLNKVSKTVEILLKKIGIKKYNLIGHSLGGAVTLVYADKHQDEINRIVLISPFVTFRQFSKSVFYIIQNFAPVLINRILNWKKPNLYAVNAFKIAYLLSNTDLYKYLRSVRKDILLVYGTRDSLLSIRPLQPLLGIMNNIHLAIFEDVRHYIFTYNSDELAEKIDLFFSKDTVQ
ncbi:MAG: alpha/beta hydrolase [Microgenomates group bacterium]